MITREAKEVYRRSRINASGKQNLKNNGQWLVLVAAVLWGTTGTAQAFAPQSATPLSVGAVRLAIGGFALFILAILRGTQFRVINFPIGQIVLAGVCIAGYQLSFFSAVSKTGVAVGTIIAIGSAPILSGLLSVVFGFYRPSPVWLVATLLAIVGCTLLILAGSPPETLIPTSRLHVDRTGITLAVAAGACYAIYSLVSKRLVEVLSPDAVMALVFSVGAVVLAPTFFSQNLAWLVDPRGGLVALHLGLVTTAAAYTLFARGLQTLPAATAVSLSLAEPLTAGLLGLLLLGEVLTLQGGIGVSLIFGGLLWITLDGRRTKVSN